jgi:cholesterol oxidase
VVEVGQNPEGGYYAIAELIDDHGVVMSTTRFDSDLLFLSAGSMNTTKLLLKAKRDGTLPSLNDQVGQNWGNNGQRIFARTGLTESVGPVQGGPACIIINDHDNAEGPIGIEYGPAPLFEDGALISACQGRPDTLGSLTLDEEGNVTTVWDLENDASAERAAHSVMNQIVTTAGGEFNTNYLGTGSPRATYHPLGGATLGAATDLFGRVQGYSHLYVIDSSLIPGSTPACNPFWTISAIAERCLDTIIAEDLAP